MSMNAANLIESTQLANNQTFMEGAQLAIGGPIEAVGRWLDAATEHVKGMGKTAPVDIAGLGSNIKNAVTGGNNLDASVPLNVRKQQAQVESPGQSLSMDSPAIMTAQALGAGIKEKHMSPNTDQGQNIENVSQMLDGLGASKAMAGVNAQEMAQKHEAAVGA